MVRSLADAPGKKSNQQQRGNQSGRSQSSRLKEHLPPMAAFLRKAWRDLLPIYGVRWETRVRMNYGCYPAISSLAAYPGPVRTALN